MPICTPGRPRCHRMPGVGSLPAPPHDRRDPLLQCGGGTSSTARALTSPVKPAPRRRAARWPAGSSTTGIGTITDKCLSLIWQKATAPDRMNWQQALQYCAGLELEGRGDWRLPSIKELATLNDYTRYNPSTDPVFETGPDWYWSSTTLSDTTTHDVVFDFIGGAISSRRKTDRYPVRAVRRLLSPSGLRGG